MTAVPLPVAEAKTLYQTVSTCYRDLNQARMYEFGMFSFALTCSQKSALCQLEMSDEHSQQHLIFDTTNIVNRDTVIVDI
jgi:hypothetical protein